MYQNQTSQEIEHSKYPTKEMGIHQSEDTWKMGLNDLSQESKKIVNVVEYAYNLFQEEKETQNLNENKARLWFWKNVAFVFSIGAIFEQTDHDIFDQIQLYFDRHEDAFFPNQCLVYDYRHSTIVSKIESLYDIGAGNYHLMLALVVKSDADLKNAPEPIYSKMGPVIASINIEEIVDIMIEVFAKYGAVKKFLGSTITGTLGISQDLSKSGVNGLPREMLKDESIRRMYRKGFLDFEANDGYELVNPEIKYHPDIVTKEWFDEDEDEIVRRRIPKVKNRSQGAAAYIKRTNNQNSLYNQIHNPHQIIQKSSKDDKKAVQLKMEFYQETLQNRVDKPNVEIYEIDNYAELTPTEQFIENATARDKVVICPHIQQIEDY